MMYPSLETTTPDPEEELYPLLEKVLMYTQEGVTSVATLTKSLVVADDRRGATL